MVSIQVSEEVRRQLLHIASILQIRRGRKVSMDEAIRHLLELARERNKDLLNTFYACLSDRPVEEAYALLAELRDRGERRLERLSGESGA